MHIKKISIYSKQLWKILDRKKARHGPSGWAMFTRCSFEKKKKKKNLIITEENIVFKNYVKS